MNQRNPLALRSKASPSVAGPALAGLAVLVLVYELRGFASVHSLLGDFHAFRCAGAALLHGADPYRANALNVCEHAPAPWGLYAAPPDVVVPAPLPPYALALFAPLALLSYPLAACLWFASLAACVVFSGLLVSRTLGVGAATMAWILLLPATVLWLPFGEATPIALLGAALAARALQTRAWACAAAGLALLAVEPHLALGAWICAALFAARIRVPLAIAGSALIGLSLVIYPSALVEYVAGVLPLHALAEVPRPAQYSITWLVHATGISSSAALTVGSASYTLATVAGIVAAARLRTRWNDSAVLVFAPLAAAVVGGTFVHASQIALALPFAALTALRETGAARALAAIACGALAVPWLQGGQQQTIVLFGAAVMTSIVLALSKDRSLALGSLACSIMLAVALVALHRGTTPPRQQGPAFPVAAHAGEYASASWGRYIWREQSTATIADWLGKAPTWLALLLLVGGAGCAAANKEPVLAVGVREMPAAP